MNSRISKEVGIHFSVFALVCLCQFMLFTVSFGYSVLPGFTIWYFPLGFHFILFLRLPYRFWVTAILALSFGGGLTMQYQGSVYYESTTHFILSMTFAIHTLPVIYLARLKHCKQQLFTLKSIVTLVLFGLLTRLGNIGFHLLSDTSVYDKVPLDERLSVFLQHNIAAYPGILFAITAFLIFEGFRQKRYLFNSIPWLLVSQLLVVLTISIITLFYVSPLTQQLLSILLFLPIIWCGYRFNWLGSLCCALWVNSLLLILLYRTEPELLVTFQSYIVAYFLIGLITAGLQLEHRRSRKALTKKRLALKAKHTSLLQSQKELQALALQIVTLQESEKKNLSQELHDDVGQNITALNLSISLLKKQHLLSEFDPEVINNISAMSNKIYGNAYELMHWLRPRSIDDLGLEKTLTELFFTSRLQAHGIVYHPKIETDVNALAEIYKTTIFRIVQECIQNVIQHSQCSDCYLEITAIAHSIDIRFYDNGVGICEGELSKPFTQGLFTLQNYVMALNGTVKISNNNGAYIHVQLPK